LVGKAQQTSIHSSATTAAKGRRHAATAGSTSRLEKYHRKKLTPVRTFIMLIEPPRFSRAVLGAAAPLPPAKPAGLTGAERLSCNERKSIRTGGLVLQNGNQAAWRRPVSVFLPCALSPYCHSLRFLNGSEVAVLDFFIGLTFVR